MERSKKYRALVDMGSNGIRFSVTDLNSDVASGLPAVYLSRAGISLYDAQYNTNSDERQPIPDDVISRVTQAMQRFQQTCHDFGMRDEQIEILATEATRVAPNSKDFVWAIERSLGGSVKLRLLAKEDEGRIGAWGIASSMPNVEGLMMDLGGGSSQLAWLTCKDGKLDMSPSGSVSMPYGAAALGRRLTMARKQGSKAVEELRREVQETLKDALKRISPFPDSLQGFLDQKKAKLYVCGGGFRGWGFVLMASHPVQPYPLPLINGFKVSASSFFAIDAVQATVEPQRAPGSQPNGRETDIFRVSERRKSQVPAVALLIQCLDEVLRQQITSVIFCQGGVREGFLYKESSEVERQTPRLWQACGACSADGAALLTRLTDRQDDHLTGAFAGLTEANNPFGLVQDFCTVPYALCLSLYAQSPLPKDLRAACALRSTSAGALAGAHGVSHFERAALALALCERWGGRSELSPSDVGFYDRLQQLLAYDAGPEGTLIGWWCVVIGRLSAVLAESFPAGVRNRYFSEPRIEVKWKRSETKDKVSVVIDFPKQHVLGGDLDEAIWAALRKFERCGKKKNWPSGAGMKFSVAVRLEGKEMTMPEKVVSLEEDD